MVPTETLQRGITISALVSALSGCSPTTQFQGTTPIRITVPLEETVPAQYKEGVSFVLDVRKFGIEHLELYEHSRHYTWFGEDAGKEHTLNILTITDPTVLPKSWDEKYNFLGYFSFYRDDVSGFLYLSSEKDDLTDERDYYQEKGFDVYWRSTTHYSGRGSEKGSPITPSVLNFSRVDQARAVFHETCHDTVKHSIGRYFSSELNESYCSLIEYAGAVEYFQKKHLQKRGSLEDYDEAVRSFHLEQDFANKVISTYSRLHSLYQSNKSLPKKMEERKKIFEDAKPFVGEEVNNAVLWDRYPYVAYFPLFYQWYEKEGLNLKTVVEKMKDCPGEEEQALEYIKEMLKNNK